jgi:hypothetical protein
VEHIIQDAGSPGIEDFAREVGADFYRDGNLVFDARRESNVESPESGGALNVERRETSATASTPDTRLFCRLHCQLLIPPLAIPFNNQLAADPA